MHTCIAMNTDNNVEKAWGGAGARWRGQKEGNWDMYNNVNNKKFQNTMAALKKQNN